MPDTRLQSRLTQYASSMRPLAAAEGSRRARNWGIYAAAAGSALAMSTAADASIIYSGPLNITAARSVGDKSFVMDDQQFVIEAGIFKFASGKFVDSAAIVDFGADFAAKGSRHALRRFFSGSEISSHAGFLPRNGILYEAVAPAPGHGPGYITGSWIHSQTAFAGILIGGDYGWIRLRYDRNVMSPVNSPQTITVIDWAYDNTGAPIVAGETEAPSTPEPGSLSLLALALGATGVLALRRKKAAQGQATSAESCI